MVVCRSLGALRPPVFAAIALTAFFASGSVLAATITVNSTSDSINATDGLCTLREAIIAANTNTASGGVAGECIAGTAGADTIQFAIPGSGVKTIFLLQELPVITEALTINGFTQTGASPNSNATGGLNTVLTIELNGSAPPPVS